MPSSTATSTRSWVAAEQRPYEKMGLDLEVLDSGFCDLAVSWRFEEYRHDLSIGTGRGCSCPPSAKPTPPNCPHDGCLPLQDRLTDSLYRSVASLPSLLTDVNVVPYLGFTVGALPLTLLALTTDRPLLNALLVLALFGALNQLEGYVLQPLVMGRQVKLRPVAIIVSFLMTGALVGVAGTLCWRCPPRWPSPPWPAGCSRRPPGETGGG